MALDSVAGSGIAGDSLLTQLNMTADVEKGSIATFSGCEFIFGLSEETSKALIYVLQDFFQATNLGKNFNEKLKKVKKEVVVMDEFAPDTQRLPQVVVRSIPVDHTPVSFGNALGMQVVNDQVFEIYGGLATLNTTIDIYDQGKPNTCALADVVFLSLMQYVRDRLQLQNLTIQPNIRFTNATRVNAALVGGELYRISLTLTIIGNWRQYLEIETVDADKIVAVPTVY